MQHGGVPAVFLRSSSTDASLAFSLAYFALDLCVTVFTFPELGGFDMLAHHVVAASSVGTALLYGQGHAHTLFMLASEVTTPFVNLRWMLAASGMRDSKAYVYNGLAMLAVWTLGRIVAFLYFFAQIWADRADVARAALPVRLQIVLVPSVLFVLNVSWYSRMVKGALKVLRPDAPHKRAQTGRNAAAGAAAADEGAVAADEAGAVADGQETTALLAKAAQAVIDAEDGEACCVGCAGFPDRLDSFPRGAHPGVSTEANGRGSSATAPVAGTLAAGAAKGPLAASRDAIEPSDASADGAPSLPASRKASASGAGAVASLSHTLGLGSTSSSDDDALPSHAPARIASLAAGLPTLQSLAALNPLPSLQSLMRPSSAAGSASRSTEGVGSDRDEDDGVLSIDDGRGSFKDSLEEGTAGTRGGAQGEHQGVEVRGVELRDAAEEHRGVVRRPSTVAARA